MKQESFQYSGVKIVDYRNGRYQGYYSNDKRDGFGIVIDDDMNFYCSEWDKGLMSGMTFILKSDGRYLYGNWKGGQPFGINVFKNSRFKIFFNYFRGFADQQAIAVNGDISRLLSFNGESLNEGDINIQISSCEKAASAEIYDDYLVEYASKHDLLIGRQKVRLLLFMSQMAEKHKDIVYFRERQGVYYFGFEKGLGIRFAFGGLVDQNVNRVSVGHHLNEKLTQIGIKYHGRQHFQEGNFLARQLIAYNNYAGRPRQKCQLIYQNYHKQSLGFVNEYFDFKSNVMNQLESFIQGRLMVQFKRVQEGSKQVNKKRGQEIVVENIRQIDFKQKKTTKENGQAKSVIKNIVADQNLKQKKLQKSYIFDASPNKKVNNYGKINKISNKKEDKEIGELVGQLNQLRYQKQIKCERCRSRSKSRNHLLIKSGFDHDGKGRSGNKSRSPDDKGRGMLNNRSGLKSKGMLVQNGQNQTFKTMDVSPKREIKYLKSYKQLQKPKFQQKADKPSENIAHKSSKSPTKEKSSYLPNKSIKQITKSLKQDYKDLKVQFNEKENSQMFIEKKIREQIYQQQLRDQAKQDVLMRERMIKSTKQPIYTEVYQEPIISSFPVSLQPYYQIVSQRRANHQLYDIGKDRLDNYLRSADDVIYEIQMRRQRMRKQFQQLNGGLLLQQNYQHSPRKIYREEQLLNRRLNANEKIPYNYSLNTQFHESPRKINSYRKEVYGNSGSEKKMKSESNEGISGRVYKHDRIYKQEGRIAKNGVSELVNRDKSLNRGKRIAELGNKGSRYHYYFDQQQIQ